MRNCVERWNALVVFWWSDRASYSFALTPTNGGGITKNSAYLFISIIQKKKEYFIYRAPLGTQKSVSSSFHLGLEYIFFLCARDDSCVNGLSFVPLHGYTYVFFQLQNISIQFLLAFYLFFFIFFAVSLMKLTYTQNRSHRWQVCGARETIWSWSVLGSRGDGEMGTTSGTGGRLAGIIWRTRVIVALWHQR